MKRILVALLAVLGLGFGLAGAANAHGHHGGGRFGFDVVIGPWWWGPPYSYYYYDPPVYYAPAAPIVVTPATAQMPLPPAYWYFCPQSNTYYPYVTQCPGGWQPVAPTPPPPSAPAAPAR